jgi:hypothetical protein
VLVLEIHGRQPGEWQSPATLNIIDDLNREVLWIEIDTSLPAVRVI